MRQDWVWIGHLLVNAASGAALGVLLATGFVMADLAGLGSLMARSIGLLPGFALLATLFGVAFAFMSAATAVMLLRPSPGPGGHGPVPALALIPGAGRPLLEALRRARRFASSREGDDRSHRAPLHRAGALD